MIQISSVMFLNGTKFQWDPLFWVMMQFSHTLNKGGVFFIRIEYP